jgi:hypothetical protein
MPVTYDRRQRDRAKADQRPLIAFDFDDRHVFRSNGGGYGRFTFQGPVGMAAAKKLRDLLVAMVESGELRA